MDYLQETSTTLRDAAAKSSSPLFGGTYLWIAEVVEGSRTREEAATDLKRVIGRKIKGESFVLEMARNIANNINKGNPIVCL